ncbi:MAG: hypothetical protein QXO70_05115, partial [Candidatus Pacearchaeota archaeon]
MSKVRTVNTKFWDDNYICGLDPVEKLVFLYLITNPKTNICGCYEIQLKRVAFDTGVDIATIKNILDRFEKDNKIKQFGDFVYIRNFMKNQAINPKVLRGMRKEILSLPDEIQNVVKIDYDRLCIEYGY